MQARRRILDQAGFLPHHGISLDRDKVQLRQAGLSRWLSIPLSIKPLSSRPGKPARTPERKFLGLRNAAATFPEPKPSRRLTYRGTDLAGEILAPAPSDTLSSKRPDVLPNLTGSRCPGADPASSHKLKSMSKACLRLLKALLFFQRVMALNQPSPGLDEPSRLSSFN
jgi:hypothetical protein